jgi:transposase, IS5 family
VPDARTAWLFRERLTRAGAIDGLLDKTNTASSVWADTAYRSKANEDFMEKKGFVSKVHRKKPHLKPMPRFLFLERLNASA